jgi:aminoglycoside phosphotransferase (APT) family kinase protein
MEWSQRPEWQDTPAAVRTEIELLLGAPIVAAVTPPGGHSSHLASRLKIADGRRVFVKSAPLSSGFADTNRAEAAITLALPEPAPAPGMLAAAETAGWFTAVYTDVPGSHPDLGPGSVDLGAVFAALAQVAQLPVSDTLQRALRGTAPVEMAGYLHGWQELEQNRPADLDPWAARRIADLGALERERSDAIAGNTLLHSDTRADNMLGADGRVILIDWAHALTGAPWLDMACLAPQMILAGWRPTDALAEVFAHPVLTDADRGDVLRFWTGLTGYWQRAGRLEAPPKSPGLRPYQQAAAAAGLSLLKLMIG